MPQSGQTTSKLLPSIAWLRGDNFLIQDKFREAATFSRPFSKGEKGESKDMKRNKNYVVRLNPRTGYQLRDKEVYCPLCGRNFGDIYLLNKHRVKSASGDKVCVDPQSVNMSPYVNFNQAIVWEYSKW
jgi:hypothetical protein